MEQRRLQVFISSTYADLKRERQAAVEAVLRAGHIPAGMELFTAGDLSQMEVIREWISDCDVFMLILGGRYGSIEPKTKKSYTHLEYDYALQLGKPRFSAVIKEEALKRKISVDGPDVVETDNRDKLKKFRSEVTSKLVSFWDDEKDIKLAVHDTMREYSRKDDLKGWVRGGALPDPAFAEELARMTRENRQLKDRLGSSLEPQSPTGVGAATMQRVLARTQVSLVKDEDETVAGLVEAVRRAAAEFGRTSPTALDVAWAFRRELAPGKTFHFKFEPMLGDLLYFDVLATRWESDEYEPEPYTVHFLTPFGKAILVQLEIELSLR